MRYSNPDDLILDPFAGIFTVPFQAIALGRKAIGFELNPTYFESGIRYCKDAEAKRKMPTLFDLEPA